MRFGALGELGLQLIALADGLLQTVAQILKVGATLLEQLFEVVLRGEGALNRVDVARRLVELLFDDRASADARRPPRSARAPWRLLRVMR